MMISNAINKLKGYSPVPDAVLREYNRHRPLGPQKVACYAPFKSIYFGHHGKAVACCFNRAHILGVYPKQSIKEIWFGGEAEKLREYIKHNDFSMGCQSCQGLFLAGNFDAVKAKQYDENTYNKNKYPSVMEFELSNVCNLECAMCSGEFSSLIRAKREKLPPINSAYDKAFVDQLEEFIPYLQEVKFYGGEPFLIDTYYDIWERIARINPKIRVSVQTNGTTLNSRIKDLMHSVDFHMNVSFDSLTKDIYEGIRKNANFEQVLENIKWMHQYCKARNTFFGISACAMRQNWHELPEFVRFCNEMDVPVYFHTVFNPEEHAIHSLPKEEIEAIANTLLANDFPNDTPVQKKNRKHFFDTVNQIKAWSVRAEKVAPFMEVKSMDSLKKVVRAHIINNKFIADDVKVKKADKIITKIEKLEASLDPALIEKSLERINLSEESLYDIVSYVEKLPVSALVLMVKSTAK
jgi:MoaA/NifB/PqqE/SkfB family radical SAM enzyme